MLIVDCTSVFLYSCDSHLQQAVVELNNELFYLQQAVVELIYELFQITLPDWTSDFTEALISVGMYSITWLYPILTFNEVNTVLGITLSVCPHVL